MDQIEKTVLRLHEQGESLKGISRRTGISTYKACKILVNTGIAPTERAEEVQAMYKAGLSQSDIAKRLGVQKDTVQKYIPYMRGLQNSEYSSRNALRIRKCREKKLEMEKKDAD